MLQVSPTALVRVAFPSEHKCVVNDDDDDDDDNDNDDRNNNLKKRNNNLMSHLLPCMLHN